MLQFKKSDGMGYAPRSFWCRDDIEIMDGYLYVGMQARDAFFKCVESDAGHTTPTEIASVGLLYPSHCKSARAFYEQSCRSTWVSILSA